MWNQFVVRIPDGRRSEVFDRLKEQGIGCAVYYPLPLHQQPCFASLPAPVAGFPESERAAKETLALPVAPGLTQEQQELVVAAIQRALEP